MLVMRRREAAAPSTDSEIIIPVTSGPTLKSGTPIISGFMRAGVLIPDRYRIPYRDSTRKTGYQRLAQIARINELAYDLRKGRVDLPTAVLLNIRDPKARNALKVIDGDQQVYLDIQLLSSRAQFFVVDGQHRILALDKLISDDEDDEKWQEFMIPFVCMLGADEDEEMDQFYIVNSKAKSVRTDLAYALLKERADRNGEVMEALVERGREWQVEGQTLVERIAETSPVWRHRIRFPAMEKGDTTISNTSLVNSLKPLVNDFPLFKRAGVDQRLKILDAYWQGVRACMREAFDEPTAFSIQKGIGVIVMHEILPDVIELVRAKGWSLVDPESYHQILEPMLAALEGDSGLGEPVQGTDFWRASVAGAAGSFSSSAGRRVLIAKARQLLPDITVE
jgi:DGQHR domain-containing protein